MFWSKYDIGRATCIPPPLPSKIDRNQCSEKYSRKPYSVFFFMHTFQMILRIKEDSKKINFSYKICRHFFSIFLAFSENFVNRKNKNKSRNWFYISFRTSLLMFRDQKISLVTCNASLLLVQSKD